MPLLPSARFQIDSGVKGLNLNSLGHIYGAGLWCSRVMHAKPRRWCHSSIKTGPLFLDIYSTDLDNTWGGTKPYPTWKSNVFVCVVTPLYELTDYVNSILRNIMENYNYKKISLNPSKPEFIVVTNKRLVARLQLFIGPVLIKAINSF